MKKLILIAVMIILCTSLVSAVNYYFVADNDGTAADVVNIINTIMDLKNKGELSEGQYKQYSNGELSKDDFDGKVGTFVYKGEATIIVGDSKYDHFADEVKKSLKKVGNIDAEIINTEKLESDNLIATIAKYSDEIKETEENTSEQIINKTPEPELYENPETKEQKSENKSEPESESVEIIKEQNPKGFFAKIIDWFKNLFS